jgi:hypothetical protein
MVTWLSRTLPSRAPPRPLLLRADPHTPSPRRSAGRCSTGEIVVLRHGRPDSDAISGRLAARRLADWAARNSPLRPPRAGRPDARRRALRGPQGGTGQPRSESSAVGDRHRRRGRGCGLGGDPRARPRGSRVQGPRSTCVPRRSRRWLRCKHWRCETFRVMGWAASTGNVKQKWPHCDGLKWPHPMARCSSSRQE